MHSVYPVRCPQITFTGIPRFGRSPLEARRDRRPRRFTPAVAWIDDAHDESCQEWARERSGPTLLLTTEPPTGITDRHVAELEQWARALATSD